MRIFVWGPEYELGEPLIDDQHREWFRRVQALFEGLETGGVASISAVDLLEAAASYTTDHFKLEELMLRAARYPDLQAHLEKHRALSEKVSTLLAAARSGDPTAPLEAAQFLAKWITGHIKTADRAYMAWMNGPRDSAKASTGWGPG